MLDNWNMIASRKWFLMLLVSCLVGCSVPIPSPSPTPTANTYGYSQDAFQTLSSLEKVDDHPLYVMHYVGEYVDLDSVIIPAHKNPGCSLFAALGDPRNLLFGRNFDYWESPALLLYTDPPDGYASISMVDLSITGIGPENFQDLKIKSIPERDLLLVDGMNEYGVAIGFASVPGDRTAYDGPKPTINSFAIMREVLDHARDVDEAVAIFTGFNIDFTGGMLHYLIADSTGHAVLIEYVDGEMIVQPNDGPWSAATNNLIATVPEETRKTLCWRYKTISEYLTSAGGKLFPMEAMDLLSGVSVGKYTPGTPRTQWSAVYEISTGDFLVAMRGQYDDVHTFHLEMASP